MSKKNDKYYDAVKDFYNLKKRYDNILINKKNKLKKLSLAEKKTEIEKFKQRRKCIKCKQIGGSIFIVEGGLLKVTCGNDTPCKLHIEIKKPTHYFLPIARKINDNNIEILKEEISSIKLDLLFDLIEETVGVNEFTTLKEELTEALEYKKVFDDTYHNLNEVVEINVSGGDPEDVLIKDYLIDLQKKYNEGVSAFKQYISQYKSDGEGRILNDAIQMYVRTLIPLQNKIREMKYQITYINMVPEPSWPQRAPFDLSDKWNPNKETPMPEFHLVPTKITVKNQIMSDNVFKIIENKK